ncbi:MAG: iron ABC transporter permease [Acetomicrobium sp.]
MLDKPIVDSYKSYTRRRNRVFIVLILTLLLTSAISLSLGSSNMSLADLVSALLGNEESTNSTIIWHIRFPRIIGAVLAGWALAMSGVVLQCILHNPLASPYTLGISQGAAFGAALAITVIGFKPTEVNLSILNSLSLGIGFFAFLGASATTWVILILSQKRKLSSEAIILSGVALSALASAGTMMIQYFASDIEVASIVFWTFGDVSRASWKDLFLVTIFLLPSFIYFMLNRWNMNAITEGTEVAKTLGVNTGRVIKTSIMLAALVTSLVVATFGVIGFIGLAAPHITRLLVGGDHRHLLPQSCIIGALLLLVADTIARNILSPVVLPVGIITSFMGAPLFLYMLMKRR